MRKTRQMFANFWSKRKEASVPTRSRPVTRVRFEHFRPSHRGYAPHNLLSSTKNVSSSYEGRVFPHSLVETIHKSCLVPFS